MSCTCEGHEIQITNFVPNECVAYSILLLKCIISDCCTFDSDSIFVSLSGEEERYPCTDIKRTKDGSGSFKCLVRLRPGSNSIHLKYGCSTTELTLTFDETLSHETHLVKILYVICEGHDGCFQSNDSEKSAEVACKKIDLGIHLIQCLIAEKLREAGYSRKTFKFIPCQPFRSKLSVEVARGWSGTQLWDHLAREFVAANLEVSHMKYVGFLSCTMFMGLNRDAYSDSDVKANTKAHVALGAGDVALYGTGCLYSWPTYLTDVLRCFENKTIVDISRLMDDSNSRGTFGGCFATTLGSLCHEIGHIFDLGHTTEGIMGNGFDFINRVFTHEKLTVSLPPRLISACQISALAEGSSFTTMKDNRLTKIKKDTKFLDEYQNQRDNDLTFFCDNSNVLLFYHKWLNHPKSIPHSIRFDEVKGEVKSILPLRLIEFRDKANALCIDYYTFLKADVFEFKLPKQLLQMNCNILALDDNGHLLKF